MQCADPCPPPAPAGPEDSGAGAERHLPALATRGEQGSPRRARVFVLVRGRAPPGPRAADAAGGGWVGESPGRPGTRERRRGAGAGPAAAHRSSGRGRAEPSSGAPPGPPGRDDSYAGGRAGSRARGRCAAETGACPPVLLRDRPRGGAGARTRGLRLVCLVSGWSPESGASGSDLQDSEPWKVTRPRGTHRLAYISSCPHPPAVPASAAALLIPVTWQPRTATPVLEAPRPTVRFEFL